MPKWAKISCQMHPGGWLVQVRSRRMVEYARNEAARRRRETEAAAQPGGMIPAADVEKDPENDDTLTLLFMCCHPALSTASAISLTLRAVGSLTTAELANSFLVPEATMAQRISRSKRTVKSSGVRFRLPTRQEREQHLRAVLHVLYLIFNEGYVSSVGPQFNRIELSREAIRLTRSVHALLPDSAEIEGLLALTLLTDSRRAARTDSNGELISLVKQSRSLWDRAQISEGIAL